jgi:two-component system CheB/CheR fusion protein
MRVWVAGCSTGEEVYSIAITIAEYLDDKRLDTLVRIIGTDLNPESITIAAAGHYPQSIEENLSEDRLRKFFTKQQAGYHVSRRIREMCTFSQHDILADSPFANLDLIGCRNLLIYLNPDIQAGIISTFHHALKPSGFLFLGKSETVGPRTLFKVESPKHKIYSKKNCLQH